MARPRAAPPLLLLLLSHSLALALALASAPPPLRHVPLSRRPVPASRAFSHAHRPWAWHPSLPAHPRLRAPAALPAAARLPQHPMEGNIATLGEYYLTLTFGGQPINVQVDTGSSTLAVPLAQCRNCKPRDHRLDLDAASGTAGLITCDAPACQRNTCNVIPTCITCSRASRACCSNVDPDACGFFLRYADKSAASGALVQADVAIAGMEVPLAFGGILDETDDFENDNVDGIFGMAYPVLACNPSCVTPLFDTLVQAQKVKHDIFSLCTAPNGGTLTLGGSSEHFYDGELQYVPMLKRGISKHFYDVAVKKVMVGGVKVKVPDFADGIVDSGTTVLVLAPRAYKALKDHFQANYCGVPGLCVGKNGRQIKPTQVFSAPSLLSGKQTANMSTTLIREDVSWFSPGYCARLNAHHISMLPNITIELDNHVQLVLDPGTYMLEYEETLTFAWEKVTYRCLGLTFLDGLETMENNAILGNTVLQKYFVEYDRENNRIGFAVAKNCVDPEARLLGLGSSIGPEGGQSVPHWMVVGLIFASVIAWVMLVSACARDKQRSEYRPIPESR